MIKHFLFLIFLIPTIVFGSECPNLYPNPTKPIISENTIELCYSFFVVHYNVNEKKSIFSSAIVSVNGKNIERSGTFKPDLRLKTIIRSSDYTHSGYDRGHLTPAGDADTDIEMSDTFFLTNIVPQAPLLNRTQWRNLESEIRNSLKRDTVIITGAIYRQWDLRTKYEQKYIGLNKIPVPYAIFKIVYNDVPVIWYAENIDNAFIKEISFSRLKTLTGIKFN